MTEGPARGSVSVGSYGETWESADVLEAIERHGFKHEPATLAKYGSYQRSVHVGLQDELPEIYSRETLKESEPIAPLWIKSDLGEGYSGSTACAFYRSQSGLILKAIVPAMSGVRVTAVRDDHKGWWRYGSPRMCYPDRWSAITINDDDANAIATVARPIASAPTDHGVHGALHFSPYGDHKSFPLTPSQFYRRLETRKEMV